MIAETKLYMVGHAVGAGGLLATALAVAADLAIEPWAQLGLGGTLAAILWWTVARTIPSIAKEHREGMNDLADAIRTQGTETAKHQEQTNALLERALFGERGPR